MSNEPGILVVDAAILEREAAKRFTPHRPIVDLVRACALGGGYAGTERNTGAAPIRAAEAFLASLKENLSGDGLTPWEAKQAERAARKALAWALEILRPAHWGVASGEGSAIVAAEGVSAIGAALK